MRNNLHLRQSSARFSDTIRTPIPTASDVISYFGSKFLLQHGDLVKGDGWREYVC